MQVGIGEQPAHGGQVVVGQLTAQEGGQRRIGAGKARVELQRPPPAALRIGEVAQLFAQGAQRAVRAGQIGLVAQRFTVVGLRLLEAALLVPHAPHAAVRLGVGRLMLERPAIESQGVVVLFRFGE